MAAAISVATRAAAPGGSFWTDRRRALAALALLVTGTGAAVMGTISAFTSAPTTSQSVASGTFTFNLAAPGAGAPFATAISGMAPGDFADRLVDVANTGSIALNDVTLTASAGTTTLLNTDAVNGLTLKIDNCSQAWTQASNTAAATCGGSTTALTGTTALSSIISTGPSYTTGLVALSSGTDHLRFHYALPAASTGTSGLTSVITYTFTATQATGGSYH